VRIRKRWILLLAYLILLAASHAWRARQPEPAVPSGKHTIQTPSYDDSGRVDEQPVRLTYRSWGNHPAGMEDAAVVMLHGSPGSSRDFLDLGARIGEQRPVIAPDLPGFGSSEHDVPSYSIRAHAHYVLHLLDELQIDRFDLVGFSMGGGVALHIAEQAPERTRSLTLLSSIGVQELELLGDYELNHGIHGLQLAGLWMLFEVVPHFGVFDGGMLSIQYARNFYDTDQRPLRGILEQLDSPLLIIHGDDDPLVPLDAAREHHRIVPQSRLELFDGDHFMVFLRSEELAPPLMSFLDDVDRGTAPRRRDADPERIAVAREPWDQSTREPVTGFSLVVVMLLIAAATLVSEDLACIGAGLLVAQGALGLGPAIAAAFIGIVIGDIGLYWAGRLIGTRALSLPPFRWVLSEARVAESSAWFERRGALVILLTRFIPGTRLPTYFSAGVLRTDFLRFSFYFLIASALWTPLLVGFSSLVGRRAFDYFGVFQRNALLGVAVTAAVVWTVLKLVPVLASWRGRRLALGFWRRLTRWEFWPWWVVYVPVFGWVFWLGIRYRSPMLFTLSNPGLPGGGFVGESKGDLLSQMPPGALPAWIRLPSLVGRGALSAQQRQDRVRSWMDEEGVSLPIVLKPDSGERGFRVQVVRAWEEVVTYLREVPGTTLVQDYVPGVEYGVFYMRRPGAAEGHVTSIAAKILPSVTGDGHSTLERLILENDRTVCQAPIFLARFDGSLEQVPGDGEVFRLGDLGTHSRGALFLDANHLITEALEREIDRIAQAVDGFYFGRFDVRAPSEEAFRAGQGIRILELNGVTSEEAHMYDPKHGVLYAWRTLCGQWSQAFLIGDTNRAFGLDPTTATSLMGDLRRYSRDKRANQ
jgi:pimeloyl-ACP methyl ester carboxylesterase/membrane protein DedA with SNARE-associated domain